MSWYPSYSNNIYIYIQGYVCPGILVTLIIYINPGLCMSWYPGYSDG